ncbi:FkbM family methyltransferase [Aestuariivirga sp.]|uniref:FkbM family methyltransferase n=1 Tax=Aestuariivirga sp. TaxID=2650926 RepID=UPI0025C389DB|nr:FkbM family methyltransferase [Aestuariivirga sp.]MCA3555526.1 FkbM family methyltransferase [Aestuariivirga sp.]
MAESDDRSLLEQARNFAEMAGFSAGKAETLKLRRHMGFTVAHRTASSDEAVLSHSFENDIFLSGVPEYQPKSTDTVLDVGAHLGDFSLLLSRRVARVCAIEARRETFALLKTNLFLNGADNVVADHLALGDRNGYCRLYLATEGESWGDSTTFDFSGSAESVACATLARYLFERNIPRVDFAKLNCEGAEFPILMSADVPTLSRFEKLLVLYHCDLVSGASERMLHEKLGQCGFTTSVRNRTDSRGWIVAARA